MIAAEKGNRELVRLFLDHNASPNHKDKIQQTPLFYAIASEGDNVDVVKLILQAGRKWLFKE